MDGGLLVQMWGRVTQIGRSGSAWGVPAGQVGGGGGFKCGGSKEANDRMGVVRKQRAKCTLPLQRFLHYSLVKCRNCCKILHDTKQKQSGKKSILIWFCTCFINHYNGFQMNYNA